MPRELVTHNKPVFDQIHPNIYGAAVGLVAWFAVAAWILFDRQSDIELPLAMVSALLLMAVLVPWSLSLVWKNTSGRIKPIRTRRHSATGRKPISRYGAASFTACTPQSTCCCRLQPWPLA